MDFLQKIGESFCDKTITKSDIEGVPIKKV